MDRIIYLLYIYLRSQVIIFVTWDIFPPRVPCYRKRRLHSHVRYITLHYDVFMLVRSTNPNKEETFPLLRSIPDGRKAGTPEKKKENSTASFTELGPSIPRTCLKLIIRWNEFKTASERFERAVKSILATLIRAGGGNNNLWKSSGVRAHVGQTLGKRFSPSLKHVGLEWSTGGLPIRDRRKRAPCNRSQDTRMYFSPGLQY